MTSERKMCGCIVSKHSSGHITREFNVKHEERETCPRRMCGDGINDRCVDYGLPTEPQALQEGK